MSEQPRARLEYLIAHLGHIDVVGRRQEHVHFDLLFEDRKQAIARSSAEWKS